MKLAILFLNFGLTLSLPAFSALNTGDPNLAKNPNPKVASAVTPNSEYFFTEIRTGENDGKPCERCNMNNAELTGNTTGRPSDSGSGKPVEGTR